MVDEKEFEKHQKERLGSQGKIFPEIILGSQDGIVNTLGVVLGISAASSDIRIILAGALAAAFAESISMGAVAYTSKLSEYENYISELNKEKEEIKEHPEIEKEEVRRILKSWNVSEKDTEAIVNVISNHEEAWAQIMVSHELGLQKVEPTKPIKFSFVVGLSALIGSIIPVIPFLFIPANYGWIGSLTFSGLALALVGYLKGKIIGTNPFKGGLQLAIIGIVSAIAGYIIGFLVGNL
jgi:VIT1/CCC1 family predicted Fe2+/Mn2+ transporter